MKIYFKVVLAFFVILLQLIWLAPWAISQPSDITVVIGVADLVTLIPQGWLLGMWIGLTFDKEA